MRLRPLLLLLAFAAALREAQIEMCKQARWRSPYYWGAFIIEGDWLSTDGRVTNIPK